MIVRRTITDPLDTREIMSVSYSQDTVTHLRTYTKMYTHKPWAYTGFLKVGYEVLLVAVARAPY